MKKMAENIRFIASQMERFKEVPKSNELCATISELPRMIEEVVDLIEQWLKSWSGMY